MPEPWVTDSFEDYCPLYLSYISLVISIKSNISFVLLNWYILLLSSPVSWRKSQQ